MPDAEVRLTEQVEQRGAADSADVVNAYRGLLGRNPEADAVVAANLRRDVDTMLGGIARSQEFRGKLCDVAAGLLTSHAMLPPAEVTEATAWVALRRGRDPDAPAAQPAPVPHPDTQPSPAILLAALLDLPPVRAAVAESPEEVRAAAARIATAPPEGLALHRLTRAATPEDAAALGLLLHGDAGAIAAPEDGLPLHRLVAAAIETPGLREIVLRPLALGAPLPVFGIAAAEAASCTTWLETRLGDTGPPPRSLGALLAALLRSSAVEAMLRRAWPEDHAATMGALRALGSGAHQLAALRTTAEDITLAYLAVLGRTAESGVARRTHEGHPIGAMLGTLVASPEFRSNILARLAGETVSIPHHGLTGEQRRAVDAWLSGRLGSPPVPGLPAPLHPMALAARVLLLPALSEDLTRHHGALWIDARARLAGWMAESDQPLIGAIDYVTGDWIAGWALDRRGEAPVEIELLCDGRVVAFGRADRPRPGLGTEDGMADRPCGFRLAWRGRDAPQGGDRLFRIVAAHSGEPIGSPFQLDSLFLEPRSTLQTLVAELRQARATLDRLERVLPQLESFTGFPPEEHAAFRDTYRILPPPPLPPGAAIAPMIEVILSGRDVSIRGLRRAVASLHAQEGATWRATILATTPEQEAFAAAAAARDSRLSWRAAADEPAERSAEFAILGACPSDSLALLLAPGTMPGTTHALAWLAHAAARCPASPGILCDEDRVIEVPPDRPDRHASPCFRAAFDPWAMAGGNTCGETLCGRAGALHAALAEAADTADRAGRCWVAWAALGRAGPLAHVPRLLLAALAGEGPETGATVTPPAALARLLPRAALAAAGDAALPGDPAGRIAVIVPTRDGGPLLAACIAALRMKAAAPERLDILVVDNGSTDAATLEILAEARRDGCRVLARPEPFNWSRLNNAAAEAVEAGLLLFLNDDTRMLSAGWDAALRRLLAEETVGAVGARLVYDDLTIQHAGVVLGVEGVAAHEGIGAAMEAPGPGGRWQRLRRVGAVTGAFLGCRRTVFERLGGFDAEAFGVTFNDVDFCLRLRASGLAVLYAPEIALVHYESKSRGIDDQDAAKRERAAYERRRLVERWGPALLLDPGFNPHWSRWTRPFTAIREPAPAEILAHIDASAAANPWDPRRG